jgi:hypothetical protein
VLNDYSYFLYLKCYQFQKSNGLLGRKFYQAWHYLPVRKSIIAWQRIVRPQAGMPALPEQKILVKFAVLGHSLLKRRLVDQKSGFKRGSEYGILLNRN